MNTDFEYHTQVIIKKDGWELTSTQSNILKTIIDNPEGVSRENLTKSVYGENHPVDSYSLNKIKAQLSHIRNFLLQSRSKHTIETIRVKGGRMTSGWRLKG